MYYLVRISALCGFASTQRAFIEWREMSPVINAQMVLIENVKCTVNCVVVLPVSVICERDMHCL